ncbi:MarR family transcriptional regulator [Sulfitobacter sp. F26169L]|uniref:MarR family winged helix-turn-helix transcriptional regulator n=1 Tax=Sulfitobacter sp. F26169L TaxID=2996015 RepID=UPI002260F4C2|nr:MarR family transcriptional regulator [Sulfitobacter sp. F26169L]MCX7565007.1 MarR family transcriptional regulator [Sulfitobacter sp. F26169L]
MTTDDFNLDDFLPYQISMLSARMNGLLSATYVEGYNLSNSEWRVLVHVARREKMSVRDIHKCVNLEKPAVSRAVTRLENNGLLVKMTSEQDHRLVEIQLTDAGIDVLNDITPKALAFEKKLLQAFSAEDGALFYTLMERLHNQLDKDPNATPRKPRADGRPRCLPD